MSMLQMTGQLLHVFKSPKGVNKDGQEYGGQHKIQLLGEIPLPNGETRHDLVTLTTHEPELYEELKGSRISVPIGAFANRGSIIFFIPKGSIVEPLASTSNSTLRVASQ